MSAAPGCVSARGEVTDCATLPVVLIIEATFGYQSFCGASASASGISQNGSS